MLYGTRKPKISLVHWLTSAAAGSLLVLVGCGQLYSSRLVPGPAKGPQGEPAVPVSAPAAEFLAPAASPAPSSEPEPSALPTPEPSALPPAEPVPSPTVAPSFGPPSGPSPAPEREVICDPLGEPASPSSTEKQGIQGKLFVLDRSQPRFKDSEDYVRYGRELGVDIFMSQLNIAPRRFREGFRPNGGDPLRNLEGERLVEYFGLELQTQLVLGPEDETGLYELAILSDDGATMWAVNPDGSEEKLLSFEGAHAPGFGCAFRAVELDRDSRLRVRMSYFQGPRHELALMAFWRRVDSANKPDPLCGRFDNGLFFKARPNATPVPQKAYRDLLRRGWRLLAPENFLLPQGRNRCS